MSVQKAIKKMLNGVAKGETLELKSALVSQYAYERKEGIKRVIKAMTVGKDVSALFPDVLKNIATKDLEQKKLVYLYLMNYAKTNPELAVLAVNTFVRDTEDPNPLVRALAIRTMGYIRVNKIVDYIHIPLQRTLNDENPYVRKTAAICVAKLYELNPEMCIEQGFLKKLQSLIDDGNPAVVSNAINALSEISQLNPSENAFVIDSKLLKKILLVLNESTEWGRITILTALSEYLNASAAESSLIIERVTPQLQHANPSVVLSSIKAILTHIDKVSQEEYDSTLKKLSAPLISLIAGSPEIQFISLRNIRIILEKYPNLLSKELRIFYIKYNDPLYLKLEKIEIMVRLASMQNYKILFNELKEYSMEIDYEFVKSAIKAIAQVSIKLGEVASNKGIEILLDLINTRNEYVLNDVTMALISIIRKFPNYEKFLKLTIPILINYHDQLDDPNAISSFIWLMGEYPLSFGKLELTNLLKKYYEDEDLESYYINDEEYQTQLQLLVTIVRINIIQPTDILQKYLQKILTICTEKSSNLDIRDRAYIYWRLLSSTNNDIINSIVLKPLPVIDSIVPRMSSEKVDLLIKELGTLSSIYHNPSTTVVQNLRNINRNGIANKNIDELQRMAKNEIVKGAQKAETLLDFDDDASNNDILFDNQMATTNAVNTGNVLNELNDLFNFDSNSNNNASSGGNNEFSKTNTEIMDLFNNVGIAKGLDNLNLNDSTPPPQQQQQPPTGKPSDDLLNLF